MTDDSQPLMSPCRCGHPGSGCYCYGARAIEYEKDMQAWRMRNENTVPTSEPVAEYRVGDVFKVYGVIFKISGLYLEHNKPPRIEVKHLSEYVEVEKKGN